MTVCKRTIQTVLAALLLTVLLHETSFAEAVGTFKRVEGAVDILRASQAAPVPARVGDPVAMGDAIRTKRRGKAEVQFRDDSVIQLAPESRIVIDEYSFRSGGSRERGVLSLIRGKVRAMVSKLKAAVVATGSGDAGFQIKTPTAIAGVKGTDFIVFYERGVSGVIFIEGAGFSYNPQMPDRVILLRGGQAAFIRDAAMAPTKPVDVSNSLIDSHVQNTNAGSEGSQGSGGNGTEGVTVDINAPNSTSAVLTGAIADGGNLSSATQGGTSGGTIPGGIVSGTPESIPVSVTHPELVTTKVKVKVAM